MTPQQFIAKWGPGGPAFELNERQGAQPHFIDLCQLLGEARGYTADMPDEEILKRLLALNLERAGGAGCP
ncbi:MAG TPA: hypothetical protein PKX82_02190 [Rhodoferax sp.]|jgi:hypothetical protein|nr:hypothetical protein [Rhodoferax sp.]